MQWIWLSLGSALLLGLYDIAKKQSLNHNAVWPVLFLCTLSGSVVLGLMLLVGFKMDPVGPVDLALLALKALIVSGSWAFTFRAIKHLPVSISAPVRASAPMFTLFAAIVFLGERPSWIQSLGILVTLASYWAFALAGRKEGIHFSKNPWIWSMLAGTLFGASSSLYDKILLQRLGYSPMTVQVTFTAFMLIIQGIWVLIFSPPWKNRPQDQFTWRWSIPLVGILLVAADQFYFHALHNAEALVSVVSVIRRSSVVIAFALGLIVFKEKNRKAKSIALIGIVCGLILLML